MTFKAGEQWTCVLTKGNTFLVMKVLENAWEIWAWQWKLETKQK